MSNQDQQQNHQSQHQQLPTLPNFQQFHSSMMGQQRLSNISQYIPNNNANNSNNSNMNNNVNNNNNNNNNANNSHGVNFPQAQFLNNPGHLVSPQQTPFSLYPPQQYIQHFQQQLHFQQQQQLQQLLQQQQQQQQQKFTPKPPLTKINTIETKCIENILSFLSPFPYFGVLESLNSRWRKIIHNAWKRANMSIIFKGCDGRFSPKAPLYKTLYEMPSRYLEELGDGELEEVPQGNYKSILLHDVQVHSFKKLLEADSVQPSLEELTLIGVRFSASTFKQFITHLPVRNGHFRRVTLIGCLIPIDKVQDVIDTFVEVKEGKSTIKSKQQSEIAIESVELVLCEYSTSIDDGNDFPPEGENDEEYVPVRGRGRGRARGSRGRGKGKGRGRPSMASKRGTRGMSSTSHSGSRGRGRYIPKPNGVFSTLEDDVMHQSGEVNIFNNTLAVTDQDQKTQNVLPPIVGIPASSSIPDWIKLIEIRDLTDENSNSKTIEIFKRLFAYGIDIEQDSLNEQVSLMCILARNANPKLFMYALEQIHPHLAHVNLLNNAIVYNQKYASEICQLILVNNPEVIDQAYVNPDDPSRKKKRKRKGSDELENNRIRLLPIKCRYLGETPLLTACLYGRIDIISLLMKNGVRFLASLTGDSPLHVACSSKNYEIVNYFLQNGHPLNVANKMSQTCLHVLLLGEPSSTARANDELQILAHLLEHRGPTISIAHSDNQGNTALHYAAQRSLKEAVRLLLMDSESNTREIQEQAIKSRNMKGYTPALLALQDPTIDTVDTIMLMVQKYPPLVLTECPIIGTENTECRTTLLWEIVKAPANMALTLLQKIFSINGDETKKYLSFTNSSHETLLHMVCKKREARMVGLFLVHKGCDINAQDDQQRTCLFIALETPDCDFVEDLVKVGANLNLKDRELEQSVLHKCAQNITHVVHIDSLISNGANPNEPDMHGNTPLHVAIISANYEAAMKLITSKNINMKNSKGQTPLLIAVKNYTRSRYMVQLFDSLLKGGADPNIVDPEDDTDQPTCLFMGVEKDMPEKIISSLIKHGADINFQTKKSKLTALHMACEQANLGNTTILVDSGANMFVADENASIPLVYSVSHQADDVTTYLLSKLFDSGDMSDEKLSYHRGQILIGKLNQAELETLTIEFIRQNVELELAEQIYKALTDFRRQISEDDNQYSETVKTTTTTTTTETLSRTSNSAFQPTQQKQQDDKPPNGTVSSLPPHHHQQQQQHLKTEISGTVNVPQILSQNSSIQQQTQPPRQVPSPIPSSIHQNAPNFQTLPPISGIQSFYPPMPFQNMGRMNPMQTFQHLQQIQQYQQLQQMGYPLQAPPNTLSTNVIPPKIITKPVRLPPKVLPPDWLHNPNLTLFKDSQDNDVTILMLACQEGYAHFVDLYFGWCAMFKSINGVTENPISVVLNARDSIGNTALHYCAKPQDANKISEMTKKVQLMNKLISKGADINAQNDEGDTPMHIACQHGHALLVQCLIKNGAQQEIKNLKKQTPEQVADINGHYAMTSKVLAFQDGDETGATPKRKRSRKVKKLEEVVENVQDILSEDEQDEENSKEHQEEYGDDDVVESDEEYQEPEEQSDDDEDHTINEDDVVEEEEENLENELEAVDDDMYDEDIHSAKRKRLH